VDRPGDQAKMVCIADIDTRSHSARQWTGPATKPKNKKKGTRKRQEKGVRYYEERPGINGPLHGTSSVKEFHFIS